STRPCGCWPSPSRHRDALRPAPSRGAGLLVGSRRAARAASQWRVTAAPALQPACPTIEPRARERPGPGMDSVFAFEKPVLELLLRGTLAYLAIVFVLRVIPKRHLSNLSPNDFIALVIIGGLTTDAIGGASSSMLDYLLMAVAVIVWSYLIDLFEFRFPGWRRLPRDSPTLVVHMGKPVRANMRRERLTAEELAASLRAQGVDDVATVKQAILEVDGQLSVIRFENGESPEGRPGGDAGG